MTPRLRLGPVLGVAVGFACCSMGPIRGEPPALQPVLAPADLWRGYDPTALPLDIEVLRSWDEDGGRYRKLRFTSEVQDGMAARVFAIEGAPLKGIQRAGILHIHGGGQTASLAWVQYWVKRGYVCVTFDFCGKWQDRADYTDWGPIRHANMAEAAGGYQVRPTPRESSWFHWAIAARRALTLLERHPAVDAGRLGIFGISVGGNLTWLVAGFDTRIRAAVPIYGSGYNIDPRKTPLGFPPPNADQLLFKATLSPEAHAPYVRCPVLHLDATNDFHAWMDASYETLGAAPVTTRQVFTPRYNHHIEAEQGANLERWMDWHLRAGPAFPTTPEIRLTLADDGIPRADVRPAQASQVRNVAVFYALGTKIPPARFWRSAAVRKSGATWHAALPVMDPWEPVQAFATVRFVSGVCLTSNLAQAVPAQLGKARASLASTSDLNQGEDALGHWFFTRAYTDPNRTESYLRIVAETGEPFYLTLRPELFGDPMDFTISSHIVGDPQFRGQPASEFTFEYRGDLVADLEIVATEGDWGPRARTFTTTARGAGSGPQWREIRLPSTRFKTSDGQTLSGWQAVDRIEIRGKAAKATPPRFRRFRWTSA